MASRLFLACGGLVLGLLSSEALVAWVVPAPGGGIHFVARAGSCCLPDPRLIWIFRPGAAGTWQSDEFIERTTINSLGMRDREIEPKRPGEMRVVAIGDSFTYGHGVQLEESWPKVLEEVLAAGARAAGPVSVLNAGQPGYGIDQVFESFRLRRLGLEPDLVLVGLHSTDVTDDADKPLFDLRDGRLVPVDVRWGWVWLQARALDALPSWLRSSKLVRLALSSLRAVPALRGPAPRDPAALHAWQRDKAVAEMAALRDLGRERGFRVAVVLMPSDWALRDPGWQPFGDVPERVRARGIPVLDDVHGFGAGFEEPLRLFFPKDKHLTAEGNRVLALDVARFLREQGLLDRAPASGARLPVPGVPADRRDDP
ncbi:MAG: SGNH/GDSL hydrolase family protein [Alphaproteobacteria bacterium]